MDLTNQRVHYTLNEITKDNLNKNPYLQFELWFKEALSAKILEPNAMSLATSSPQGKTNLRTVLLKYFDESGFVFFTNYASRKAQDISSNSQVCLLFPWLQLQRQVIIQGRADKISKTESTKYFLSRPYGSQLGAWISHQSKVITNRSLLEQKLSEIKNKFKEGKVPIPDFWGGYRVQPERFEFWQGRPNRLHDRFQYIMKDEKNNEDWIIEQLAP